ncbi:YncE family protein [Duganella sp. FT92W]|uniref:YncE family protein n=1 Tax=Pseudoduganella rivuli TaxID=2666085 RepID=A0A7X2LWE9_9BURK|nr:YncE family protein [Pseudoduganella rivuli]MRV76486.1 YncE family protein [Pseudoduganella rivuli]
MNTRLLLPFAVSLCIPAIAGAAILAMMNYETKSADSLKVLKNPVGPMARKEGIAIIDVDPTSKTFGKIVKDIPLPADLVAHHLFYNHDMSKAYVTALGKTELRVMDMKSKDYAMRTISVPTCSVGEDIVFSPDHKHWYLSCMGTQSMVVGDARSDKVLSTIKVAAPYPHGLAVHGGADRILLTSTVRATDLGDAGEVISAVEASTGKVLGTYKMSAKPSPSGVAPVEILFVPNAKPAVAYVTNMFGGTLWTASWRPEKKDFDVAQAYDFADLKVGVPLEMYFNQNGTRMYVTTAKPGHLHIFDISAKATEPKLMKSIPAAEGAHHVAFTKDGKYAFVQNALLNLPGMSDGAVTVIDLQSGSVVASMDTLKNAGLNPNSIVLLPQWNDLMGH